MWIRSRQKDYYDHIQKYVTGGRVFVRNWVDTILPERHLERSGSYYPIIVGFCGKIYGYFCEKYEMFGDEVIFNIFTSVQEYVDKPRKYSRPNKESIRKVTPYFFEKEDHGAFISLNAPIFIGYPSIKPFINGDEFWWTNSLNGYKYAHCPLHTGAGVTNGVALQDLGFDRIIDAENAYTNLVSYVDFLGREYKSIPEMSNETKIEAHGFGPASFRSNKCEERS
jgi:hypothetical protein